MSPVRQPFQLGPYASWLSLLVVLVTGMWGLAIKPLEQRLNRVEQQSDRQQGEIEELKVNNAEFGIHIQKLAEAINKLADRIE